MNGSECPVCLDKIADVAAHTRCGHRFCRACLERSVRESRGGPTCPTCRAPVVTFAVITACGDGGAADEPSVDEHVLIVPECPPPDSRSPPPPAPVQSQTRSHFATTCSLVMLLYFLYIAVHVLFPSTMHGNVTYCQIGHAVCSYRGHAPSDLATSCSPSIDQDSAEVVFGMHEPPVV